MPTMNVARMELTNTVGDRYAIEPTPDELQALAQAALDLGLMVMDGSKAKHEHVIFHPPGYGIASYRSAAIAHTHPDAYKDAERIARAVEAFGEAVDAFREPDDG